LVILNNWRAAHAYPLQVICSNLRQKNPNAIVVQRLKRLESITGKIQRFPEMQLYKMQDLGGCRVIVDTIEQVYNAIDRYKFSRIRHILKREYDYIANPKESGYRSYHMVYQFHSESKDTYNKNMFIEIQFRTKLQHMWATAVEMMGIYTKSNLKSSQGDYDILRFFTLVSSLFAIEEKMPICPNTSKWADELISEIKYLDNKNNIISTLSGLNVSINHASNKYNQKDKNLYYIILLNYDKMTVTVKPFKSSNLETATKLYGKIEQGSNINVVLVSASSFETLRLAYPNYFADISYFVTKLRRVIENYDSIKKLT
jgi:putative GTP pyrophosphokinase